jgi:hypothetical protein
MASMTDTTAETAAPSVNGTAPGASAIPPAEPCADCVTSGEKGLAVLALGFALFIAVMAVDMFTGGRISGYARDKAVPGD